jgi:hypothetical protein
MRGGEQKQVTVVAILNKTPFYDAYEKEIRKRL